MVVGDSLVPGLNFSCTWQKVVCKVIVVCSAYFAKVLHISNDPVP